MIDDDYSRNATDEIEKEIAFTSVVMLGVIGFIIIALTVSLFA